MPLATIFPFFEMQALVMCAELIRQQVVYDSSEMCDGPSAFLCSPFAADLNLHLGICC